MTDKNSSPHIAALQELEAALDAHRRTQATAGAPERAAADAPSADSRLGRRRFSFGWPAWFQTWGRLPRWRLLRRKIGRLPIKPEILNPAILIDRKRPWLRKLTFTAAGLVAVVLIGGGALWWRLLSGPISLDIATPWLTSAVERNFGNRYRIEVGGTLLERDAQGRTALRLRDIVLRDTSGASVAVAPKADIGLSGASFLIGNPRVESFRLVDANMTMRIDQDGQVNVILGGEQAVQRDCAHPGAAGHDARSGQSGAIIVAACRNACAGPRGSAHLLRRLPRQRRKPRQRTRPRWPDRANSRSSRWPSAVWPTIFPRWSSGSTSSAGSVATAPAVSMGRP